MELDTDAHDLIRHAEDIPDRWQGKVLAKARDNNLYAVCSMLAHEFDPAMGMLLSVVKPPCWDAEARSLKTPFCCSIAKVAKTGRIVVDMIDDNGATHVKDVEIYRSIGHFRDQMRRLADVCRLTDHEREQFFKCTRKWIAADRRLDPTMDPADPDAKRLVN